MAERSFRQAGASGRAASIPPAQPASRRVAAFALDPSLTQRLDTRDIGTVTLEVPWEKLAPGPVGEYLEVIDVDPTSRCYYEPVDLDHPHLLARGGLQPSEGTPQFHQQMTYAVAQVTIDRFERALGRKVLWSPRDPPAGAGGRPIEVRRLRIYPHALRDANAYYSPARKALLFGYFQASADDPGDHLPGGFVFTALSQDIIAHETTHALLDGLHPTFLHATNPDMQAFHEAFADVVALLQHFTFPEVVRDQVARTRGALRSRENLLGELAVQFGRALGSRGALRQYIGSIDAATGQWRPHVPNPAEYEEAREPHARGAVLVAAIFDAFLAIYERRTRDLFRIATNGTGALPDGDIHPDLVNRLADEAASTADHVLRVCIRALDYCAPVDVTFGEYLRALVTADRDLVPDDALGYRVAFIEAFRRRAIYPRDVRALSEEALVWRPPLVEPSPQLVEALAGVAEHARRQLDAPTRSELFARAEDLRAQLDARLQPLLAGRLQSDDARVLGLEVEDLTGVADAVRTAPRFAVRSVRFAERVAPDGRIARQCVIELLSWTEVQRRIRNKLEPPERFEGGSTVIVALGHDVEGPEVALRYAICKSLRAARLGRQFRYDETGATGTAWDTYFGVRAAQLGAEPFATLHGN
jgi:hypothetical protein